MERIKQFLSDKNRVLIIAIIVMLVLAITGYAMTVASFTDYNPPDHLYINWYDYTKPMTGNPSQTDGTSTTNNAISAFPRWSVEYPYRAIFLGGTPSKVIEYYVVYSKVPTTDLFTFEYISGDKSTYQLGRIRAYISSSKVGVGNDYRVIRVGHDSMGTFSNISNAADQRFDVNTSGIGTTGSKAYFSFDFYYDCASEHQQNAGDLKISGVTSISGVPYKYVTKCLDHVGGHNTGGSSGGASSGGGSSSGGSSSSSGGGSDYPWENDSNTPNYNVGLSSSPGSASGSEGAVGEKGDTWTLPEWVPPDLPWSDEDLNIPSMPDLDFPEMPVPNFNFPEIPEMPEIEIPNVPYDPGDSSWPPQFPVID